MADITVELIPDRPLLPITDEEPAEYGNLNYIFYPGISKCQQIRLTNNTGDALTPHIYFDEHETDTKWWKTMRIYPTCSGVLPSGVWDLEWEGEIAASGTQDLYIMSVCTKEGFSWKYQADYWTNDGFAADLNCVNDTEEQSAAVDCDAADAGATLTLDTQTILPSGTSVEEEFVRIKFSTDGVVNAIFDIQYSDDGTDWTTVYANADLSGIGVMREMTFWWDKPGAHRYWRILKTNAAAAGANITDIQWLLFEAHKDAFDFGVYGDHKCLMRDTEGYMDDFEWRTSVMVNIDVFSRQNYQQPIGKVGSRTKVATRNLVKYGETVQLYYIPAITMSYSLNNYPDFQLERRVWNVKAIITPQKRNLTYTAAADGLQPSLYRYEQRNIILECHGPDQVGWYMTNYDFWHAYGHSFYIMYDDHCYKLDNIQPVYFDDELVAFSGRLFLQSDMVSLGTDPRNYILTNRNGNFQKFPIGGYNAYVDEGDTYLDTNTPEQRPAVWSGAYIITLWGRTRANRPNPYSLTTETAPGPTYNGEIYEFQEWNNPETIDFTTALPVAFGARVDAGTGNARYFQMPRYYNWIGYVDANGFYDVINWLVQLYYDEDCTIPVRLNLEYEQTISKVEYSFDRTYVTAAGLVTLTRLGGTIYTDGHYIRTPSKLYVKYISEDGQTDLYYP